MSEPGLRGLYEGTDKEGRLWRIARHAEPAIDGTRLAAHHPRLFDVSAPDDSVPLEEFDRRLEALMPADVVKRIDKTIDAAKFLATKGLADEPPASEHEWRRGMILSWSHARDLVVVHDALGHPRDVAGHDMDEVVLARRLQEHAGLASADPWYRDYVNSLDEGAWINVGFFNPHLSASMYKWGDAKHGAQNAMDAHRFAAHHQGTPERPLDWVERAVNFVVHHIPREHWGIRHEARGTWADLEPRLAEDPAIKDAGIGKAIARDAARLYQLLEAEGKVVPWQLLAVPRDTLTPSVIEHAHLVALASQRAGDEAMDPARVARAEAVLRRLPAQIEAARAAGHAGLADRYTRWLAQHR